MVKGSREPIKALRREDEDQVDGGCVAGGYYPFLQSEPGFFRVSLLNTLECLLNLRTFTSKSPEPFDLGVFGRALYCLCVRAFQ